MPATQREALKDIFVRHGVVLAYLFGSQAEGTARAESDVDIAVLLPGETPPGRYFEVRLALTNTLMDFFDKNVDVAVLNDVRASLAFDVVKHGQLLYEDPITLPAIDFAVAARSYYFDTEKFRRLAQAGLAEEISAYRLRPAESLVLREKPDDD
jgi:hypothetical protein